MRFLESIRFEDGKYHLLDLHQERMNRAFEHFYPPVRPHNLRSVLPAFSSPGKHKFRVEYDNLNIRVTREPYQVKKINSIQLVESPLAYGFKFADRFELNVLLAESKADEIIIVRNGFITDSSYANLAFFDGSNWWTPSEPLLGGVRRADLLKKGEIQTVEIKPSDLHSFQTVCLINAMLDLGELTIPISSV